MAAWTGVSGKRVLITGATNGIGLAAAVALAGQGAELAIVARDPERGRAAAERIRAAGGGGTVVDVLEADLSSQASVRRLAAEALDRYSRLEVLVNNAGAIFGSRQLSEDGIEMTWAVNHLAPFLLTNLLLDRLRESAPARVVTTSSGAHGGARIDFADLGAEHSYAAFRRYGQSKLANILFTRELASRLEGSGVTANCFHPGFVATGFNHNNGRLLSLGMRLAGAFARRPERGAETLVWLAGASEPQGETGGYYADRRRLEPSAAARDPQTARRLWEVSAEQTGLAAVR